MRATKFTKETILLIDVQERPFDDFAVGDTIAVSQTITEDGKTRVQVFEGGVIAFHNKGAATTFTVRKIGANSVSIERIFPYYSPTIQTIKRIKQGDVRRAKLYYIRDRIGKNARLKEKVVSRQRAAVQHNEPSSENGLVAE